MIRNVNDFPPLYPLYFPVHGAQYVAPPGGITLKIKELSAWIDDFSIQNFLTGDVLFNAKHSTWTKTTKFNNPQGNRICKFSGTSFNVNRPVEDANHKRLYKVSSSGLMIERKLWTVVTFDGQLRTVQMEATYGDANIYVVIGGQKQLVAVNNCNGIFKNSHITKIAEGMDIVLVAVFIIALDQMREGN